jgi:rhodanese-related sulfurtransferase
MATTITREALKARMDAKEDFVLVDVLSPDSYRQAHLPGAVNIPFSDIEGEAQSRLPRGKDIIVYCASFQCHASPEAARKLEEIGFARVIDYEGGLADWRDAGYPVESTSEQRIG